jgi:hypothetical protein
LDESDTRNEAPPDAGPRLLWRDAGARTTAAGVFQVTTSREETTLLFGNLPGEGGPAGQARLEASVILSPATAQRLAAALHEVLRQHERRYGALGERLSGGPAFPAAARWAAPPEDLAAPEARQLFALVCGLGADFGYEKSFKLTRGGLFPRRFLLALRRRDADAAAVIEICRRLGMPGDHLAEFEAALARASTVGFGFEEGGAGRVIKAYLEFWDQVREAVLREPARRDPMLLHLGFKWDSADSRKSGLARYTVFPLLPVPGILERLRGVCPAGEGQALLETLEQVLGLARARISRRDSFVYVEASEDHNPRRSFDVNLYKAELRLGEVAPILLRLAGRFGIPGDELPRLLAAEPGRILGHLSGGLDREGREFLTAYYEIEAL